VLRLLRPYVTAWRETFDMIDPAVCRLAATHVHDLMAMALGATRGAAAVANGRGMRAARLNAVKADIAANLTARDLSVSAVALRQRVTPHYIHLLFEGEGTTFAQFVLGERLAHARRMLLDPRHAHSRSAPSPMRAASATCPTSTTPFAAATGRRRAVGRSLVELADIDEAAGDGGGGGHLRRDEMGAAEPALPPLEIAI
jgi:AraC-like DNA-binding protein